MSGEPGTGDGLPLNPSERDQQAPDLPNPRAKKDRPFPRAFKAMPAGDDPRWEVKHVDYHLYKVLAEPIKKPFAAPDIIGATVWRVPLDEGGAARTSRFDRIIERDEIAFVRAIDVPTSALNPITHSVEDYRQPKIQKAVRFEEGVENPALKIEVKDTSGSPTLFYDFKYDDAGSIVGVDIQRLEGGQPRDYDQDDEDNLADFINTHKVALVRYPHNTVASALATVFTGGESELSEAESAGDLAESVSEMKAYIDDYLEWGFSRFNDLWSDEDKERILGHARQQAKKFVTENLRDLPDETHEKVLVDGMTVQILKSLPDNFDLIREPEELARGFEDAIDIAVGDIVGIQKTVSAHAGDIVILMKFDEGGNTFSVVVENSQTIYNSERQITRSDNHPTGEPFKYEDVSCNLTKGEDGFVQLSVISQQHEAQVRVPEAVDMVELEETITDPDIHSITKAIDLAPVGYSRKVAA